MQDIKYFNNKRILITGGGGYLGSKLAEKISESTAEIFLLDIAFNEISAALINKHKKVEKLLVNLTDFSELKDACQESKPDIIFHFGAVINRERDFSLYDNLYEINVKGTFNLLKCLEKVDYKGFYFASTGEVYGTKNTSPFSEDMMPAPVSPYSCTKLMAENLISTYSSIQRKPFTILRMFLFYGPSMPRNFFISQLEFALNNDEEFKMTKGEQRRDFLHIDILINYLLQITATELSNNEIINVCSGKSTEIRQLALEFAKSINKEHLLKIGTLPYRSNEIWDMYGNNQKLIGLLSTL